MTRLCSVNGCERTHEARGLCKMHWTRQYGKATVHHIACGWCGRRHLTSRSTGRFCSEACAAWSRARRTTCSVPMSHPSRVRVKQPARPSRLLSCGWCEAEFTSAKPSVRYCSHGCKHRAGQHRRRAAIHMAGGSFTWAEFMRVFLLFERRCAYCDLPIDCQPDPDHVVPLSRGGWNGIANILPACNRCNGHKRDLLLAEWALDRVARDLAPVRTNWSPADVRFAHLLPGLSG